MITWLLDLQLPVQSVPITTKVVSSNLVHNEVYSIQNYVIKFVSDLWQVGGFLRFPPPNKTVCHDITEILLKKTLNTIIQPTNFVYFLKLTFVRFSRRTISLRPELLITRFLSAATSSSSSNEEVTEEGGTWLYNKTYNSQRVYK